MKLGDFFSIVVTFWEYMNPKKVLEQMLFLEFDIFFDFHRSRLLRGNFSQLAIVNKLIVH